MPSCVLGTPDLHVFTKVSTASVVVGPSVLPWRWSLTIGTPSFSPASSKAALPKRASFGRTVRAVTRVSRRQWGRTAVHTRMHGALVKRVSLRRLRSLLDQQSTENSIRQERKRLNAKTGKYAEAAAWQKTRTELTACCHLWQHPSVTVKGKSETFGGSAS